MKDTLKDSVIRMEERSKQMQETIAETNQLLKAALPRITAIETKQSNMKYFVAGAGTAWSVVGAVIVIGLKAGWSYITGKS